MGWMKVVEWVDIDAPQSEVFQLIIDLKRRVQLSPLWGVIEVDCISDEFPREGSLFRTRLVKGVEKRFDSVVTAFQSGSKLSYQISGDETSRVTWTLTKGGKGTRLVYEEEFQLDDEREEELRQPVREAVRKWLNNIQRYSELRATRSRRLIKWFLDRYFLKLKTEQRNVIAALLFMKAVSIIAFIMAALAYGIATIL
jgi:hypothetical protein